MCTPHVLFSPEKPRFPVARLPKPSETGEGTAGLREPANAEAEAEEEAEEEEEEEEDEDETAEQEEVAAPETSRRALERSFKEAILGDVFVTRTPLRMLDTYSGSA